MGNQPPGTILRLSGSNLAFNKPAYPYGIDHGYGMRTEIGTATFRTFEKCEIVYSSGVMVASCLLMNN